MSKNIDILRKLGNLPVGTGVIVANTPVSWLIYLEVSPGHCFYIVVEKINEVKK